MDDIRDPLGSWRLDPPSPTTRPPAKVESEPCCTCCLRPGAVAVLPPPAPAPVAAPVVAAPPAPVPAPVLVPVPVPVPAQKKPRRKPAPLYVTVNAVFANAVWKYRVNLRESHTQFAERAGVDPGALARMESGKNRLLRESAARSIATAAEIANPELYFKVV